MKNSLMMLSAFVMVLALAGCANDYVIATKEGSMILTSGQPKLDAQTGLISYTDEQGNERQINTDEVTQVMKR